MSTPERPPDPISISIAEASQRVGISQQVIRRLIREEGFPAVQMGGPKSRWVVPVDALRTWLAERSTAA